MCQRIDKNKDRYLSAITSMFLRAQTSERIESVSIMFFVDGEVRITTGRGRRRWLRKGVFDRDSFQCLLQVLGFTTTGDTDDGYGTVFYGDQFVGIIMDSIWTREQERLHSVVRQKNAT